MCVGRYQHENSKATGLVYVRQRANVTFVLCLLAR